ncbi:MAG: GWxTD domain-containing protein [Owenweeksia sp.]|nr:GWxTD domain-containing protein [Owenweeksia sp.]
MGAVHRKYGRARRVEKVGRRLLAEPHRQCRAIQGIARSFLQRVQEANILFSSYLEGWKSDRGIIYVIYGPPSRVYRSTSGESWVYGDESSALSYHFNFLRVGNPFTDNDYSLERSSTYRYGWGQAIESWRNGHIYNSKI